MTITIPISMSAQSRPSEHRLLIRARFTAGTEDTADPKSTAGLESTDYGSADSGHIYPKTQALKTPAIGTVYNEKAPYI